MLPSNQTELRVYNEKSGRSLFERWFAGLDRVAAAKVSVALVRLEQGNFSNVKGVGEGVLEYRIDFGPGYRVYFGMDGASLVILLAGGTKSDKPLISLQPRLSGPIIGTANQRTSHGTDPQLQGSGAKPHHC